MNPHGPIIGVLLAGQRSSRFGGGDKCLSALAGKPLLPHAIERRHGTNRGPLRLSLCPESDWSRIGWSQNDFVTE
jgi:molybdopterin-guanine dinucleotide biosynthesis protein A